MSTREKPYRSKANAAFFQLIQSALQSTFFLVHESGPTSFALKDEQGKVIKVSLGSTHTCTCGGGRSEHCIHTLYVLLKIFRVLPDNPIIWQTAFIDSEINWLIRNRMHPVVQEKTTKKIIPNSQVARIDIKEEFGCAICQEDLKDLNGLIFCKEGCGHNFHLKCMKIWAEFKTEQKNNITCPLCRCNWGAKTLGEINKLMRKNKKKPQIHSRSTCVGCGCSPITGVKYHCLMCYEFDFCSNCFRTQHGEHPFIKKSSPSSNWEPAVRMNGESLVNREFSPEDYEFLQQLDTIPILSEYIFSLLPDASPGVCQICKVEQQTHWKRLACGHTVHDVCIIQAIRDENYSCDTDGIPCLFGLGKPVIANETETLGLAVMGLHVGNPALAFRQRRKPVQRKQEVHSAQNNRPQVMELPPLIVTRLTRKN